MAGPASVSFHNLSWMNGPLISGRVKGEMAMSKNRRQMVRKPAMKFANLRKKMLKQKTQVKKPTGKRK
jgi:hypothetical protein